MEHRYGGAIGLIWLLLVIYALSVWFGRLLAKMVMTEVDKTWK